MEFLWGAAGERSNVTISKDPQEGELPAPDDFSTRGLKSPGAGSALSCRPFVFYFSTTAKKYFLLVGALERWKLRIAQREL